ncbi:hypothetical protein E8E11_005846 [Didymella keratinophila]|nr:hypothetical protein E8E11_005846 [Didymella keratinophila]
MSNPDPFHDLVPGYLKLAGRMSVIPGIAMFRRFGASNARNLSYVQNDLYDLEEQLKKPGPKMPRARKETRVDTKQHDLIVKMPKLLKEHSHALMKQTTILCHKKNTDTFDLRDIQSFLGSEQMSVANDNGKASTVFIGPDESSGALRCAKR